MESTLPAYSIQGREVTLPCEVRRARSGAVTYLVDASAARAMLPGDEFDVVELLPGRAMFSIAAIDYEDNDLGDYNEVSIAFFVRERSAPRGIPYLGTLLDFMGGNVSTYIHWLPVNQSFTQEAGSAIWGFPKSVEQIEFEYTDTRARCRLDSGGQHVLTLDLPRGGRRTMPDAELTTYTHLHGVAHRTRFTSGSDGFGFGFGSAQLELGEHPYAEGLRGLGLPKRPLFVTWMEQMHGSFGAPEKL